MRTSVSAPKRLFFQSLFYLGLALLWMVISFGLNHFANTGEQFTIRAIFQAKLILIAIVFTGRYLLFPQYRQRLIFKYSFILAFFTLCGFTAPRPAELFKWGYLLLLTADVIIWSLLLAAMFEISYRLFEFWGRIPRTGFDNYSVIWRKFWEEALYFGFWVTSAACFAYYYSVSFLVVDPILYSYLLLIVTALSWVTFFTVFFSRIRGWVDAAVGEIDREIEPYLKWREFETEAVAAFWPRLNYLLKLRDYLVEFKQPVFSLKTVIFYLGFSGFILLLPYFFAAVIEV